MAAGATVRRFPLPLPGAGPAVRALQAAPWLRSDALQAALASLLAIGVYNATLTPSLSYLSPDGNELATVAATLGLTHPTGYPLYTWLGKAFTLLPVGDAAHRVNLFSAVGAAGAAGLAVLILRELRIPRPIAVAAGLVFAFSPTLWAQATIAEVYAPNALFVALELYLLLLWGRAQRDPGAAQGNLRSTLLFSGWALTYSLSLGLHLSGLGFGPAFAAYILMVNWRVARQPWVLVPGATVFVAGLLQFLWIPVRYAAGAQAPDPVSPLTVDGFLAYTVNAFPQFRWAFPLELMPDRFIVYSGYVLDNFGWPGIFLAFVGAFGLAIRRPRTFLLISLMWVVQVVFFMGYRAQDLDVFFIPSHLLLTIAMAFGAATAWRGLSAVVRRGGGSAGLALAAGAGSLALLGATLFQLERSYAESDRSDHTEINDFYKNVFELLPENATLVGTGGVFGYDMFYYPLVYGLRPDVTIPAARLGAREPVGPITSRNVYSVSPEGAGGFGLTAVVPEQQTWSVPVLVAPSHEDSSAFIQRNLVLYRETAETPSLLAPGDPERPLEIEGNGADLTGVGISATNVVRGDTVTVRLYWRVKDGSQSAFSLRLGGDEEPAFQQHPGFGLLERYSHDVEALEGQTIMDEFDLVVLSSAPTGMQPLVLTLDGSSLTIAELEVR